MSSWTYLWVDLIVIVIPFIASFDKRVAFVNDWKAFWPACLLTMMFFIAWDVWFTNQGIWGFNDAYLIGIEVLGLPLEEFLFFIAIPYACVFTYACFRKLLPTSPIAKYHRTISICICVLCLAFAATCYKLAYLGLTSALCAVWLIFVLLRRRNWMAHFWFTYIVLLLPFLISNGVLTGLKFWSYPLLHNNPETITDQVVWYNNLHNSNWRIFSMPVDDLLYGMLLIGINISLFEWFKARKIRKMNLCD